VVLVGNGRGYLSAIVTGDVKSKQAQAALDAVQRGLPHYKQIRAFHLCKDPFSIDSGLLDGQRQAQARRHRGAIFDRNRRNVPGQTNRLVKDLVDSSVPCVFCVVWLENGMNKHHGQSLSWS